ncbi:MAG TPA: MarR family transcriptional regulator [Vitreimonas sp.]|jgi:DNA-binding MarR family transcriptional regulator|nr:MarR family transcriptional regulator [Vitreimonas sp.]
MAESDSVAQLAEALSALVGKLKRRLRERATLGDLSPSQIAVVLRLEREGEATSAKLAQAEGMRPQSMGAIVQVLQTEGLVEAAPDPSDGRQLILSLTAACKKKIKANRAARRDWLAQAIQTKLTAAEQKQLSGAIDLLKRLADE